MAIMPKLNQRSHLKFLSNNNRFAYLHGGWFFNGTFTHWRIWIASRNVATHRSISQSEIFNTFDNTLSRQIVTQPNEMSDNIPNGDIVTVGSVN
ncbi:12303_t:CDS:2, partial [Funneliformis mosseae]